MGLTSSKKDPCLFSGIINDNTPPATPWHTIHVGIYVDLYILFFDLVADNSRFKKLLNKKVTTEFMGDAYLFLRSSFKWNQSPDRHLSVHVYQQAFSGDTASLFGLKDCNGVTLMTPYRSGCPIDSISDSDPNDPKLLKCKSTYQYIWVSINWIAISTRPDVSTVLSFLTAYQGAPNNVHYIVALHALIYIVITYYIVIAYHSDAPTFTKYFFHFPPHHYTEAYSDVTPARPD